MLGNAATRILCAVGMYWMWSLVKGNVRSDEFGTFSLGPSMYDSVLVLATDIAGAIWP